MQKKLLKGIKVGIIQFIIVIVFLMSAVSPALSIMADTMTISESNPTNKINSVSQIEANSVKIKPSSSVSSPSRQQSTQTRQNNKDSPILHASPNPVQAQTQTQAINPSPVSTSNTQPSSTIQPQSVSPTGVGVSSYGIWTYYSSHSTANAYSAQVYYTIGTSSSVTNLFGENSYGVDRSWAENVGVPSFAYYVGDLFTSGNIIFPSEHINFVYIDFHATSSAFNPFWRIQMRMCYYQADTDSSPYSCFTLDSGNVGNSLDIVFRLSSIPGSSNSVYQVAHRSTSGTWTCNTVGLAIPNTNSDWLDFNQNEWDGKKLGFDNTYFTVINLDGTSSKGFIDMSSGSPQLDSTWTTNAQLIKPRPPDTDSSSYPVFGSYVDYSTFAKGTYSVGKGDTLRVTTNPFPTTSGGYYGTSSYQLMDIAYFKQYNLQGSLITSGYVCDASESYGFQLPIGDDLTFTYITSFTNAFYPCTHGTRNTATEILPSSGSYFVIWLTSNTGETDNANFYSSVIYPATITVPTNYVTNATFAILKTSSFGIYNSSTAIVRTQSMSDIWGFSTTAVCIVPGPGTSCPTYTFGGSNPDYFTASYDSSTGYYYFNLLNYFGPSSDTYVVRWAFKSNSGAWTIPASTTINVDYSAPILYDLTGPLNQYIKGSSQVLQFSYYDSYTSVYKIKVVDNSITRTYCISASGCSLKALPTSYTSTGDGLHKVSIIVYDKADNPSTKLTYSFTLDSHAPGIVTESIPNAPTGKNGWYKTNPLSVISLYDSLSGTAKVYATWFNASGVNITKTYCTSSCNFKTFSYTLTNGIYTNFQWVFVDVVGNLGTTKPIDVYVDTAQPSFKIINNDPTYFYLSSTNIAYINSSETFSMDNSMVTTLSSTSPYNMLYAYKWDKGSWVNITSAITAGGTLNVGLLSSLSQGSHTLYIQLVNEAGTYSLVRSFAYTIDNSAPMATPLNFKEGGYNKTGVNLQLTVTDKGSGLSSFNYCWSQSPTTCTSWVGATSVSGTSSTISIPDSSATSEGTWYLYLKLFDNLQNSYQSSTNNNYVIYSIIIDNTPPTINTFSAPPSVLNPATGVNYQYEQSGYGITITLTDGAGISGSTCANCKYKAWWDSYTSPATFTLYTNSITVSVPNGNGNHILYLLYEDELGNVIPLILQYTYTADNTGPTITNSKDPSGTQNLHNIIVSKTYETSGTTIDITLTDTVINTGIAYRFWWNDTLVQDWTYASSFNYVLPSVPDGLYNLTVQDIDALGNIGTATYLYHIDNSGPTITNLTLTNNSFIKSNVNYTLTFSDNNGVGLYEYQYQWTTTTTAGSWTTNVSLTSSLNDTELTPGNTDGVKYLLVRVIDLLGNGMNQYYVYTFTFDNNPPTVQSITPNGGTVTSSMIINVTLTDGTGIGEISYYYWWDSNSINTTFIQYNGIFNISIPTTNGQHTLHIISQDGLGNVNPSSLDYTYTVNNPAPPSTTSNEHSYNSTNTKKTDTRGPFGNLFDNPFLFIGLIFFFGLIGSFIGMRRKRNRSSNTRHNDNGRRTNEE